MATDREVVSELRRMTALFQARALASAMGLDPNSVRHSAPTPSTGEKP